jgi:hypothetical protein
MATTLQYPLRIKQTLTQTGTGTQVFVNNDTAISGFETLNSTLSTTGQWFRYTIEDGTAYEVGSAYWNASVSYPSFYRYPIKSSNSNNRIDLSGNAVLFATTTDFEVSPKQLLYEGTVSSGNASVSQNFYDLGNSGVYNTQFTKFEVEIDRLTPVNDGSIYLRVLDSSNNAVTTSIYQGQYLEATGSTEYGSRNTYSYVALNRYHYVGGGTGESGWSGSIFFHHHHDEYGSDQYPIIRSIGGYINTSNDPTTHQSFVNYLDYSDIYGFYLYLSSTGGFESGGYKVYGLF